MTELGNKRWTWWDSRRYGQKVGIACYENAVVCHAPSGFGGMNVLFFDSQDLADECARFLMRGLVGIGCVWDRLDRQDMVALRKAFQRFNNG